MGQATPAPNPAEAYERFIAQNIFVPWTAELIRAARPMSGERVLDLACGTGIVTRTVAPLVGPQGRVVGLDISPAMLAVARSLAPADGAPIEWYEGSGTEMPFPDGSFDLVLCQQGLQFFPDKQAGLNEVRRVLAPEGRAVVSVWRDLDGQPFMKAVDTVVDTHLGPGGFALPFSLSDSTLLEQMARAARFEEVDVQEVRLSFPVQEPNEFAPMMLQGAAAVLPNFAAIPEEDRQATIERMKEDLAQAIQPFMQGNELVLDMAANVLIAQR